MYRARASLVPIPFALVRSQPSTGLRTRGLSESRSVVRPFGESTPHPSFDVHDKIIRESDFGGRRIAGRGGQHADGIAERLRVMHAKSSPATRQRRIARKLRQSPPE